MTWLACLCSFHPVIGDELEIITLIGKNLGMYCCSVIVDSSLKLSGVQNFDFNRERGTNRAMVWQSYFRSSIEILLYALPWPQYPITPCWWSLLLPFFWVFTDISVWVNFILVSRWKGYQSFLPSIKHMPTPKLFGKLQGIHGPYLIYPTRKKEQTIIITSHAP